MSKIFEAFARDKRAFGLFVVNFVFQRVFRITSLKVPLIHFTNVITAENGFNFSGEGEHAERCLRLNGGIHIQASNGVTIDRSVLIAPGVKIISGNHDLDNFSAPSTPTDPLEIGANCWLGANAIVLAGVRLGPGTIVGAGSVVTKSFEQGNIVIAGNPARVVRSRS